MCTWDPDIKVAVDVCEFKQTIEAARREKTKKNKMEIYTKAWKLYIGEFLPARQSLPHGKCWMSLLL